MKRNNFLSVLSKWLQNCRLRDLSTIQLDEVSIYEFSNWPPILQLICFSGSLLLTVALIFLTIAWPRISYLRSQQTHLLDLKTKYAQNYTVNDFGSGYSDDLGQAKMNYETLLTSFPVHDDVGDLLNELSLLSKKYNLFLNSLNPGIAKEHDLYFENSISLSLSGTYENFSKYLQDLLNANRLITVANFELTAVNDRNYSARTASRADLRSSDSSNSKYTSSSIISTKDQSSRANSYGTANSKLSLNSNGNGGINSHGNGSINSHVNLSLGRELQIFLTIKIYWQKTAEAELNKINGKNSKSLSDVFRINNDKVN